MRTKKKQRKHIPQSSGVCPHCGAETLDYEDDVKWDCDSVGFYWRCQSCRKTGVELHSLTFITHVPLH